MDRWRSAEVCQDKTQTNGSVSHIQLLWRCHHKPARRKFLRAGFLLQNLVRNGDHYEWRINLAGLKAGLPNLHGFPAIPEEVRFDGPAIFIAGAESDYVKPDHHEEIDRPIPSHKEKQPKPLPRPPQGNDTKKSKNTDRRRHQGRMPEWGCVE